MIATTYTVRELAILACLHAHSTAHPAVVAVYEAWDVDTAETWADFLGDAKLAETFRIIGPYNDRLWETRVRQGRIYTYHELCLMSPIQKDREYAADTLCLLP